MTTTAWYPEVRNDFLFAHVHKKEKARKFAPDHANDFIKSKCAVILYKLNVNV